MSISKQGFTLVELAVAVLLIALVVGLLLPGFHGRHNTRPMQSNTQVRGIHQSMVMYAQGNGMWFPGFDANGEVIDASVEHRYQVLLEGNYFTGEYMISPSETKTEWTTGAVTSDNYSFAMLDIDTPGNPESGRAKEWRETLNTEAAVMSDRNTGADAGANVSSIHTGTPGDWQGTIAWNDNHTVFNTTHLVDTLYGAGEAIEGDNLFEAATGGDDAYMIFSGD